MSGSSKDKSKLPAKISLIVPIATIIGSTLQEEEKENAAARIWRRISEPKLSISQHVRKRAKGE